MDTAGFVDGEWIDSNDALDDVNPSDTSDVVGRFGCATADDARNAVVAARQSLAAWSQSTTQARSDLLARVSAELIARKEEIGELVSREAGKTRAEGMGEVVRAAQIFQFFSGEAVRYGGENLPSVRPGIGIQISRDAVGVVSIITPWNFPVAILAWKIAPALAFGNTVVVKPSEHTPAVAFELVRILQRHGAPRGVVNLVNGPGAVLGDALTTDVDAISFTGSVPTGRRLARAAAERMIRIQLEMGGKNPLVVLDDADLSVAVDCALNGSFFSAGQRCTASSRLIVQKGIHDAFVKALLARMKSMRIGNALDKGTDIGPVINQSQLDKIAGYLKIAADEGASVEGGRRLEASTPGFYLEPALLVGSHNGMRSAREEIFGPVASVIEVANYDEALDVANDTEFGLSSGICTTSLRSANHFRLNVRSGLTMINLPTAGLDYHVPFGGTKGSSYGPREQGGYAVDFYTTTKTAYVGY